MVQIIVWVAYIFTAHYVIVAEQTEKMFILYEGMRLSDTGGVRQLDHLSSTVCEQLHLL